MEVEIALKNDERELKQFNLSHVYEQWGKMVGPKAKLELAA